MDVRMGTGLSTTNKAVSELVGAYTLKVCVQLTVRRIVLLKFNDDINMF